MTHRSGVAFCLFLAACAANPPIQVVPGQNLTWDDAVTVLNTGEVVSFAQFHSLEVELELADGDNLQSMRFFVNSKDAGGAARSPSPQNKIMSLLLGENTLG